MKPPVPMGSSDGRGSKWGAIGAGDARIKSILVLCGPQERQGTHRRYRRASINGSFEITKLRVLSVK